MAQGLANPQRYRGFILTATGLQKLHDRIQQLEAQTRLRQSPRTIAERIQLSDPEGIHSITVRKILCGQNGVDRRSIQLVFQVLQLQLEEGDYAHAGLCQKPAEICSKLPVELAPLSRQHHWNERSDERFDERPDASNLSGRVDELNQLYRAIVSDRCRLVQILGVAGVGKTSLATLLTKAVQPEFELITWKSLRHAPAIETVLTSILQALSQQNGTKIELPASVETLTGLLIEQLQTYRCLIVLDHFSSVLSSRNYAGCYCAEYEAYRDFLQAIAEVSHQSCLIITSREKPRTVGLAERYSRSLQLSGLSASDCRDIFDKGCKLAGTADEWQFLVKQYDGNPLALKLLKGYIEDYFSSISNYLNYLKHGNILFGDLQDLLKQQFDRLSFLEQALVFHLAQYPEPVAVLKFCEDIASSLSGQPWLEGVESLERRSFLRRQRGCLVLDPLLKTYVHECLAERLKLNGSPPLFAASAFSYSPLSQISSLLPMVKRVAAVIPDQKAEQ